MVVQCLTMVLTSNYQGQPTDGQKGEQKGGITHMERLVILLPAELKAALAKAAEADRRSMSQYVAILIEKHLAETKN